MAAQIIPNVVTSGGCAFRGAVRASWEIAMMGSTATVEFTREATVPVWYRQFFILTDAGTRSIVNPFGAGYDPGSSTATFTLNLPSATILDAGYTAEGVVHDRVLLRKVTPVPEPATVALLGGGLALLGGVGAVRRQRGW